MITRDPYGISRPPINPGRLPEPYPPAETMDTPENVERCLCCTLPVCNGECPRHEELTKKRNAIAQLAEVRYNGGTDRFAMELIGLTKDQIRRYERTVGYEREIERLRRNRRGNTSADK